METNTRTNERAKMRTIRSMDMVTTKGRQKNMKDKSHIDEGNNVQISNPFFISTFTLFRNLSVVDGSLFIWIFSSTITLIIDRPLISSNIEPNGNSKKAKYNII